ncbi:MAG: hypothetical protein ABIM50_05520 [Novosphingobium sp.]
MKLRGKARRCHRKPTLDGATGHNGYAVNAAGPSTGSGSNLSSDPAKYVSSVAAMIGLLQPVMEQYIVASRRFAVRLALQCGLKSFAAGLEYDVATDSYKPSTDRELAPMFEAIFRGAPASNAGDAVLDYLTAWNQILWQVSPDYHPSGAGNLLGGTVAVDQAFIMQMLVSAYENVGSQCGTYVPPSETWGGRSRRAAAACNDNGAWREATFRFSDGAAVRVAA